jgi:hypothetical protein
MNQARVYTLSDPAAIALKVRSAGGPAIDPAQPIGQASADGVTIGWDIANGQIAITVISKPWIVPYGTIWSHIDDVLG